MAPEALLAWKSLYFQVFVCSCICGAITITAVAIQMAQGQWRPTHDTLVAKLLYVPKIWWRCRILYFSGVPAILLITALYIAHLGLNVLTDI